MPDTPTPAEQLRAAAKLLRERAAAATPSDPQLARPWHVEDCADRGEESNDCPCIVAFTQHDDSSGFGMLTTYVADAETPAYAAWIALIHPGVGEALADWLEATARDCAAIGADRYALAVARALLGGAE